MLNCLFNNKRKVVHKNEKEQTMICTHSSVEGAQYGKMKLHEFLDFCKKIGAKGAQPSNGHLEDGKGGFLPVAQVRKEFADRKLTWDGISAHGPFWALLAIWTGTKTCNPFIPENKRGKDLKVIEDYVEGYCLDFLDYAAAAGIKVIPMFWGPAFGLEVMSGYPWSFWKLKAKVGGYDLIEEGKVRFVKKTTKVRDRAREHGIKLCDEIHPNTAALCKDDFLMLLDITENDPVMAVIADPTHCWAGEPWWIRFGDPRIAERICAVHLKNFHIRQFMSLLMMDPEWAKRAMQFTDLATGDLNMKRFVEFIMQIGYPARFLNLMAPPKIAADATPKLADTAKPKTAPLPVEAESAGEHGQSVTRKAVEYTNAELVFEPPEGSFEEGMGQQED